MKKVITSFILFTLLISIAGCSQSKWSEMCKYLASVKEFTDERNWTYSMVAQGEQIVFNADAEISEGIFQFNYDYRFVFTENAEAVDITSTETVHFGKAWYKAEGEGKLNLKDYIGGEILIETTEIDGTNALGAPVTNTASLNINETIAKSFMNGIKKIMSQYDNEFTLKDLGFLSYDS